MHDIEKLKLEEPEVYKVYRDIQQEQVARVQDTYHDLMTSDVYHRIAEYFFSQIYGVNDKVKRDEAFNRIYEKLTRAVGFKRVEKVTMLKELNEITDELDIAITRYHIKHFGRTITRETYEKCYVGIDKRSEREYQIELLKTTTQFFHKLAHFPMISLVIKPTKLAAKALGVGYIMDFFMDGYHAFRSVDDPTPFIEAIEKREQEYLDRLYEKYAS